MILSPIVVSLIGVGCLFGLMLLQVPVGIALAIAGVLAFAMLTGVHPALALLSTESVGYLANADIAVIPLFLLMGGFAGAAGLSDDLYRLAEAVVGHRRGGLAYATIGGCAGFGAVCGSSVATAATMARVALPEMRNRGYSPGFAAGTIAAGGTLGILIPPSIVIVIYAVMTEQFIITLFAAAVVPALIAVAFQFLTIYLLTRWRPGDAPSGPKTPWGERVTLARQSWRVLSLILIISGGIYSGVFTANEAAAAGAVLAGFFAWRRGTLSRRAMESVLLQTAQNTAMIYLMVIGASIFTYFLTVSRIPNELVAWIEALQLSPITVILTLMLFYLVLGCFFETVSSVVITLPFVFPLIVSLGFDPVWFGIVCVMVIELGLIHPPLGMNLLVIHSVAPDISITQITFGTLPYLIFDFARLGLLIAFPSLALWLPNWLGLY